MDLSDLCDLSPFLASLRRKNRLAPSRLAELVNAAQSEDKPKEPPLWECCGSSCKPCIKELYRQELRVWKECHPDCEVEARRDAQDMDDREGRASTPQVEITIEFDRAVVTV